MNNKKFIFSVLATVGAATLSFPSFASTTAKHDITPPVKEYDQTLVLSQTGTGPNFVGQVTGYQAGDSSMKIDFSNVISYFVNTTGVYPATIHCNWIPWKGVYSTIKNHNNTGGGYIVYNGNQQYSTWFDLNKKGVVPFGRRPIIHSCSFEGIATLL